MKNTYPKLCHVGLVRDESRVGIMAIPQELLEALGFFGSEFYESQSSQEKEAIWKQERGLQ
ncbi:MAG: hypothetical protein WCP72_09690 [Desulfomonile sp.]|jgi:hypothetical protein